MSPLPAPFALELSSQGAPVPLLEELTERIVRHVGCAAPSPTDLHAALQKATGSGGFGGAPRCDLQFRARNQALEILVSANGGRIWQTSCAMTE